MNQQLVDYVKQQLQIGKVEEEIKGELRSIGWQEGDIVEALGVARSTRSAPPTAPKGKSKTLIIIISIILALGLVGTGLAYFFLQSEVTPQVEIPKGKVLVPKTDTADWDTYQNEEYGFEIKYPLDWIVAPQRLQDIGVDEFIFFDSKESGLNQSQFKIHIAYDEKLANIYIYVDEGRDKIFEQFTEEVIIDGIQGSIRTTYGLSASVEGENHEISFSALPTSNRLETVPNPLAVNKEFHFKIPTVEDISLFETMLSTFRFIEIKELKEVSRSTIDTSGWGSFRSDKYRFELRYPADWTVSTTEDDEDGSGYTFSSSVEDFSGQTFYLIYVLNDDRWITDKVDSEWTEILGYEVRIEEDAGINQAYITRKLDTLELGYLDLSDQQSPEEDKALFETILATLKFDEVAFGKDVISYQEKIRIEVVPWPFREVSLDELENGNRRRITHEKYDQTSVVDEADIIYTKLPSEFMSKLPDGLVMIDEEFISAYSIGYFTEGGKTYHVSRSECSGIVLGRNIEVCIEGTFYVLDVEDLIRSPVRLWPESLEFELSSIPPEGRMLSEGEYKRNSGFYDSLRNDSTDYLQGDYYYLGVSVQKQL